MAVTWCVFANIFPEGVVVLGGDVLQPMNFEKSWPEMHYEYLGRVSLFYGVFFLLERLSVSESGQLSWYLGMFLFAAYLSFYGFAQLVFRRASDMMKTLVALLYATNIYTLYIFTATWGFTHYQILYVFIPVLTGLYIRALTEEKTYAFSRWFLLAVAFASVGFGNPAFALGLGIYFMVLTVGIFTVQVAQFDGATVKKMAAIALGAFLLNAYWILPLLPQVRSGVASVSASTDIVLSDSLRKTSAAFFDTIRLLQTHESELYYPRNFPYPSFEWMKDIIATLAFVPFFLVLAMLYKKREDDRRIRFLFMGLFTVMAALVAHVRFPFDGINSIVFQLPGLNVLRGWDKLAIYMPFILSVLVLDVLMFWQRKRSANVVGVLFFFLTVLLALPFYVGGIQTKMSYILAGNSKKDFQTAGYSALVRIPKPYYDIGSLFERDREENKIARLPFSPGSSVGRINLPEWGVNGPSVENALYSKKYIEPNNVYFSDWMFAKDFEKSQSDPRWITDWYGLVGVKYVMWHKDAKREDIEAMSEAVKYLKARGDISVMTENKWFTLYRIDDASVFPYVYGNSGDTTLYPMVAGMSEKVGELRRNTAPLKYERKNPREIVVSIDAKKGRDTAVFLNEKFDSLWKAEFVSSGGERTVLIRDENVRYANAWRIDERHRSGSIDIYYGPARFLKVGIVISAATLIAVLGGLAVSVRKMT
jgi:hypothetical protein